MDALFPLFDAGLRAAAVAAERLFQLVYDRMPGLIERADARVTEQAAFDAINDAVDRRDAGVVQLLGLAPEGAEVAKRSVDRGDVSRRHPAREVFAGGDASGRVRRVQSWIVL
jgi:hypothetical protein